MERYIKYANIFIKTPGKTTIEIIGEIKPKKTYAVSPMGLVETLRGQLQDTLIYSEPNHVEVFGRFIDCFATKQKEITIPIAETSRENLAFYNCKLIGLGDSICFDTLSSLPVTLIDFTNSVANLTDPLKASLVSHYTPHLYMPISRESTGHLILGRLENKYLLYLSAFKIPFGYSVYISPYVFHNDLQLNGEFLVVYDTNDPVAINLVNTEGLPVKVKIENNLCKT